MRSQLAKAGTMLAAISTFAIGGLGVAGWAFAGRGDPPPPSDPSGGGDPGGMIDDESIGSLPVHRGGLLFLTPGAPGLDLPPSFFIEGPTAQIVDALISGSGVGYVALHPTSIPDRSVAIVYGDLHLDLDAALFCDPQVVSGLVVGAELGHVAAGMFYGGRLVARTVLAPLGRFDAQVGRLYELGALKDSVDLFAAHARGGRSHFRISAHGAVISLHQMN